MVLFVLQKETFIKNQNPKKKIIENINHLYKKNYIIIFTSRFMGRSNENISMAKKRGYKFTFEQLNKWGLKFHKLVFGKPSYDVIVDDKSFHYKKNWMNDFKKKYK